jgi:hypothetical protein
MNQKLHIGADVDLSDKFTLSTTSLLVIVVVCPENIGVINGIFLLLYIDNRNVPLSLFFIR